MVRYIIGLAIGFLGGWLLWQVGGTVFHEIGNGESLMRALTYPPMTIRLLASLAAFSAGLATLTNFATVGLWLAGIATFMFGVLVAALYVNGSSNVIRIEDVVYLVCMTALFLGLFITRKSRKRLD